MFSKLWFCLLFFLLLFHATCALLFGKMSLNHRLNQTARIGARQRALNSHKRMPQYMMQLYRRLTMGDDGGMVKKKMPYSANAIRGLNSVFTIESKYSMTLEFKLHYLNNGITVTRDEIHIYMEPPDPLDSVIFKPFVLTFIDIGTNKTIRTYRVPAFNQGWQVLSLNKFTNKWVKDPSLNRGIRVIISRGGKHKYANKNPFINFPPGNSPYMILFASESDQSLMAWRFLIQNALNSVAGNTQSRKGRDLSQLSGQRISRNLSQQSTIDKQPTHTTQPSQCKAVETDMNLGNFKVNGGFYILHPKVYKMINCSSSCVLRPATGYISPVPHIGKNQTQYCCVPTKYVDLMVLLKDPNTGDIEVQMLENFVPTDCKWSKQ